MTRTEFFCATLFMLVVTLAGCAKPRDQFKIDIEVRHSASSSWTVNYHLSEPVQGLVFVRQRNQFRVKSWQVQTPGAHLANVQGVELVYSDSGAFSDLQVTFSPYAYETPKDYEFFVPYSDGSTSMFTGHLEVVPLSCKEKINCSPDQMTERTGDDLLTDFTFVPLSGEHIITGGTTSESPVSWSSNRDGVYVYFGKLPSRDYGAFTGVVDPNLPTWVAQTLQNEMARILDFYSTKTGFRLESSPVVYFPYVPVAYTYSAKGGVLPGQVRLALAGEYWSVENSENRERFLDLLAHEGAHFWNADLFLPQINDGESWLHEGGADAWANRALLALGYVKRDRYLQIETEALNRCVLGLGDVALTGSDNVGRFRNSYDCGAMIGSLTEDTVRKSRGLDLFAFWTDVFKEAAGHRYSPQLYFDVLDKLVGDSRITQAVASLSTQRIENIDEVFRHLFSQAGASLTASEGPSWYSAGLGERALRFLAIHDCGEGHSVVTGLFDSVRVDGDSCHTMGRSSFYERAGSFNLVYEGGKAYDFIRESCRAKGAVSLELYRNGGAVTVPCSSIPPRPRYLEFK